jgi:hypothetical protein
MLIGHYCISFHFFVLLQGMAYALLAGQPLTIVGSTGPVLAFISALYKLAKLADLPFLPVYAWTGLWTSGFLTLYSLYSLSLGSAKYLRYRTTHTKKKRKTYSSYCHYFFGFGFHSTTLFFECLLVIHNLTFYILNFTFYIFFFQTAASRTKFSRI